MTRSVLPELKERCQVRSEIIAIPLSWFDDQTWIRGKKMECSPTFAWQSPVKWG
jgi:hypothetical protein